MSPPLRFCSAIYVVDQVKTGMIEVSASLANPDYAVYEIQMRLAVLIVTYSLLSLDLQFDNKRTTYANHELSTQFSFDCLSLNLVPWEYQHGSVNETSFDSMSHYMRDHRRL
jgi:hypothetical protein